MLTKDELKAGNGKLSMKDVDEYETDYFSFGTYVEIDGEEERIQGGSVAGNTDISEQSTGTIESKDGYSISFNNINHIYMIVEWRDIEAREDVSEWIDLYDKQDNEDSFLNNNSN